MGDPTLRTLAVLTLAAIAGVLLWQSFTDRRLVRLIIDTPTSRPRGVFIGFNEVVGRATAARPLVTRFSREPCIWHDYAERQQIRQKRGNRTHTTWIMAGSDRRAVVFDVVDDSGSVRVNPAGAQIIGDRLVRARFRDERSGVTYSGSRWGGEGATGLFERREDAILVDATVYVLGSAHLADDGTSAEIRAEPGLPLFITTQGEAQLTRRMRRRTSITLGLAVVAGASGGGVALGPMSFVDALPGAVLGTAAVLAVHLAHTTLLVYNNLVRLGEREARAWSLIDVQLDRRAELIPQLATCVSSYTRLEADVQQRLAELRSGTTKGTADDRAPDELPDDERIDRASAVVAAQSGVARSLIALAEAYPELRADELFAHLRGELVDSENRVAAAREFFNDSVTARLDQSQVFPASIVARWAGTGPSRHFALDGVAP
jgi:hypothetical protein